MKVNQTTLQTEQIPKGFSPHYHLSKLFDVSSSKNGC